MNTSKPYTNAGKELPTGRIVAGSIIMGTGFLSPLLIPLVAQSGLSTEWKTVISGFLLLGIPEVFMLAAIAVMGKEGFDYLKSLWLGILRRHGPPERVSKLRYNVGLFFFIFPLLVGLLDPYLGDRISVYQAYKLPLTIIFDVIFVGSVFILGGEFWDKLRSLFIHDSKVLFAGKQAIS
jgi:hypothetical protein